MYRVVSAVMLRRRRARAIYVIGLDPFWSLTITGTVRNECRKASRKPWAAIVPRVTWRFRDACTMAGFDNFPDSRAAYRRSSPMSLGIGRAALPLRCATDLGHSEADSLAACGGTDCSFVWLQWWRCSSTLGTGSCLRVDSGGCTSRGRCDDWSACFQAQSLLLAPWCEPHQTLSAPGQAAGTGSVLIIQIYNLKFHRQPVAVNPRQV